MSYIDSYLDNGLFYKNLILSLEFKDSIFFRNIKLAGNWSKNHFTLLFLFEYRFKSNALKIARITQIGQTYQKDKV